MCHSFRTTKEFRKHTLTIYKNVSHELSNNDFNKSKNLKLLASSVIKAET